MKKKILVMLLVAAMACSLWGCGGKQTAETESAETESESEETESESAETESDSTENTGETAAEPGADESDSKTAEDAQEQESDTTAVSEASGLSFADFRNLEFSFSSGAGGWGTMLYIDQEGNFRGEYSDSDMGVTGDGYPNGTVYQCDFTGQFTQPVKVNEYTYSMRIQNIEFEQEPGTEEIRDETLYCYTEAYGLNEAEDILVYLPGAPLSELPEEYRSWVGYSDGTAVYKDETELPFYGLYNEVPQEGFQSYDVAENLKMQLEWAEESAASLEQELEADSLTQADYNEKSGELYELWDTQLNLVWNRLKQTQSEETMAELTKQEREWIQQKEQAVTEAAAEYEGGSMQPMIANQKAAELTKARVYELMEEFE